MGYPVSSAFWSASSNWYAAKKSAQNAATRTGVGPLARKEAQWTQRGSKYLRGRPDLQARASVAVRVDPKLYRDVLAFLDQIAPDIVTAFDEQLGALAMTAWKAWPVDSGLSRSMIALEYRTDGDKFVGSITNLTPYVFFIKGQPHRELLDKHTISVGARIAEAALGRLKLAA
jgi:hypothetical protein